MLSPTHMLTSAAVAGIAFCTTKNLNPKNFSLLLWIAFFCGIIPDIPNILWIIKNFDSNYDLFNWTYAPKLTYYDRVLHSLFLWLLPLFLIILVPMSTKTKKITLSISLSPIVHILGDGISHLPKNRGKDYLWPTNLDLTEYIGMWDYFKGWQNWPGPEEKIILISSSSTILISLLINIAMNYRRKKSFYPA